jgi:hypothetical protein
MTRLTMLFIAVALVLPGAAFAMPDREPGTVAALGKQHADLRAPDRDSGTRGALDEHGVDQAAAVRKAAAVGEYYASYRNVRSLPAPVQEPATVATDGEGLSWTLAIGAGIALMLAALGVGVYAGRTIHPRHIGA